MTLYLGVLSRPLSIILFTLSPKDAVFCINSFFRVSILSDKTPLLHAHKGPQIINKILTIIIAELVAGRAHFGAGFFREATDEILFFDLTLGLKVFDTKDISFRIEHSPLSTKLILQNLYRHRQPVLGQEIMESFPAEY